MIFILFLCLIWNNCNLEMVQRLMGPFHWIIKCGGGPPLPSPLLPSLTVVCCPPCLGGSDSWTGPAVPGSGSPATACAAPQSSPPPLSACNLNIFLINFSSLRLGNFFHGNGNLFGWL